MTAQSDVLHAICKRVSYSGLVPLLPPLSFDAFVVELFKTISSQKAKQSLRRMRHFFFYRFRRPLALSLFRLPSAFLDCVHAHGSGAERGFHASRVKGQRLLKPVAVLGLYVAMDGYRPHAQWL